MVDREAGRDGLSEQLKDDGAEDLSMSARWRDSSGLQPAAAPSFMAAERSRGGGGGGGLG